MPDANLDFISDMFMFQPKQNVAVTIANVSTVSNGVITDVTIISKKVEFPDLAIANNPVTQMLEKEEEKISNTIVHEVANTVEHVKETVNTVVQEVIKEIANTSVANNIEHGIVHVQQQFGKRRFYINK